MLNIIRNTVSTGFVFLSTIFCKHFGSALECWKLQKGDVSIGTGDFVQWVKVWGGSSRHKQKVWDYLCGFEDLNTQEVSSSLFLPYLIPFSLWGTEFFRPRNGEDM